jgi:membrane-associated HD superfamily phosphohydrolase
MYNKINSDVNIFLHLFLLFIVAVCYLIAIITKYSFYKYVDYIKSKSLMKLVFISHWIVAIVCALLIPNYLKDYNFYNDVVSRSPLWEYVIILFLLFTTLIVMGFFLNSIFCNKTISWEKSTKSGSR